MRGAAVRAHPRETGGILVGVWSDGRPWVTHACEVRSHEVGFAHYVLPAGMTRRLIDQLRRVDSRLGYLGDWHTHPQNAGASEVDYRTVQRLARTVDSNGRAIVLLIARRPSLDYVIDAHLADRRGARPTRIVRTGNLAELATDGDT